MWCYHLVWKYLVADSIAALDPGDGEERGRWDRYVDVDLPGDGAVVCLLSGEAITEGKNEQWSQHLSPSTFFLLPNPWDCPIRENAFAVPIPSGIVVTWAVWLMIWCQMTLCLLLSRIRNRNSHIHIQNCSLIFISFYDPPWEPLPQVGLENWRWNLRLVCLARCVCRDGMLWALCHTCPLDVQAGFNLL